MKKADLELKERKRLAKFVLKCSKNMRTNKFLDKLLEAKNKLKKRCPK